MKLLISLWLAAFFSAPFFVHAEYNGNKLGEAIGAYISTTALLERVSETVCGEYLKHDYDTRETISNTKFWLLEKDFDDIVNSLKDQDFAESVYSNYRLYLKAIEEQSNNKEKLEDTCIKLNDYYENHYFYFKDRWDSVKKKYGIINIPKFTNIIKEQLRDFSRQINTQTPIMVDDVSKIENVMVVDLTLLINFRVMGIDIENISEDNIQEYVEENIRHFICKQQQARNWIDYGVTFVFSYWDMSNKYITEVKIKDYDCQ